MTMYTNPSDRSPKGDHNRRLSMGLDRDQFANAAGITVDELREYETTGPDHEFSVMVAGQVGDALDHLETVLPNSEAAGQYLDHRLSVSEAITDPAEETFEARVRKTAYLMWEEDGRPHGRDDEYWHMAREVCLRRRVIEEEVIETIGGPERMARGRHRGKPATRRH